VILVLDQASKQWVLDSFSPDGEPITSCHDLLQPRPGLQPGAAFSFLADAGGWQKWLLRRALALGISAWLLHMLRSMPGACCRLALSLILGGALGNLIDRLRFDAVVDFLDFHLAGWYFPAFNVADSAITVGVALMLLHQFRHAKECEMGSK
jgi:signal peptidase II